jgi:DNA-directed RNA polymerase specialized sigma24 family protein
MAVTPKKKLKKSTIIHEGSDKPKSETGRHYIDNVALYAAFVERRKLIDAAIEAGEPTPAVSDYLASSLYKIAQNLSRMGSFASYPYRDEMVQDAILVCIRYIDKFKVEESENPFSYFTQTCTYAFISRIHIEKKQMYVKFKSTVESATMGELSTNEAYASEASKILDNIDVTNEYMEGFVSEYELKQEQKKNDIVKKKGLEFYIDDDEEEPDDEK